jgi:hypothetical protein
MHCDHRTHPALSKPALLTHVFKFAARDHKDAVKLLHVDTAWEDTATNYCPWLWERVTIAAGVERAPPLEGSPSLEQWTQHCFACYLCRVWTSTSYAPSLFTRLVAPVLSDLRDCRNLDCAGLKTLCSVGATSLHDLDLSRCTQLRDSDMTVLRGLQLLRQLRISCCCGSRWRASLPSGRSPPWTCLAAAKSPTEACRTWPTASSRHCASLGATR